MLCSKSDAKGMDIIMQTWISFIAAILTTCSFISQAVKVIKTKNTTGISVGMYLMFTIGVLLWTIYGIITKQTAIVIANAITFVFATVILKYSISDMITRTKKV